MKARRPGGNTRRGGEDEPGQEHEAGRRGQNWVAGRWASIDHAWPVGGHTWRWGGWALAGGPAMTTVATFDQVLAQIWAGLGLGQPMFFLKDFFL